MPEESRKDDPRARPVCGCGFDRDSHWVSEETDYGFWAWVLLLTGATGTPKRIMYRCQRCREVIEATRDPEVLRAYR